MKENAMTAFAKFVAVIIYGLTLTACGGSDDNDNTSSGGDGMVSPTVYTVTPSVPGTGGTISPTLPISVQADTTAAFQVVSNTGYTASVSGTCGGTLSGTTYTTKAITSSCTVIAAFTQTNTGASIANCFAAPSTVSYAMYSAAGYAGSERTETVTVGPVAFNGQTVTKQSMPNNYWAVTSSGIVFLGYMNSDDTPYVAAPPNIIPLDLQPGKFVDFQNWDYVNFGAGTRARYTFVGFETVTLAGKEFPDTCHFQIRPLASDGTLDASQHPIDEMFASGYGMISSSSFNFNRYYAGE